MRFVCYNCKKLVDEKEVIIESGSRIRGCGHSFSAYCNDCWKDRKRRLIE